MKRFFILFIIAAFIAACHKKAVPEISSRTNFPEAPRSAQLPVDNSPEVIAAGKTIFETKCNRCHELKDTKLYNEERWASILKNMIPRTKLTDEQSKQVTSYVLANAKK